MGRCHDRRISAAVVEAVRLLPVTLRDLARCEFVIGVDPLHAGIHRYVKTQGDALPYSEVAHCVYDFHQLHRPVSDRTVKVVLPRNPLYGWDGWSGVRTVVHELGHVLHDRIGLDWIADPTTRYGRTNHHEAFADAFADWIWGGEARAGVDGATAALLDGLAER